MIARGEAAFPLPVVPATLLTAVSLRRAGPLLHDRRTSPPAQAAPAADGGA
ncbi:hypothetical protein ACFW2Y_10350 [Streptomyces sp. NPDC058877]|uniref:hypothetical protein n=1 Tax=Streptomyces sp. NPDC058877 TaxID=3346665 RepID=UPI0036C245E9